MDHLDTETLAAYQDNGLAPAERASARAHFAECAECRDRLGAQVRAAARGEGAGHDGAGAGVAGAIGRPDRSVFRERLAAAAIGALLLGAGLWWALDRAPADRAAAPRSRDTAPVVPGRATPPADEAAAGSPADAPISAEDPALDPPADNFDPELLALRGGAREVAGKTFRLRGDEWVDDAWTAPPGRPPIMLARDTDAWRAALAQRPALARYSEVGPRVLVVLDSFAFRILPAP